MENPSPDFDPYLLEELINYAISSGLKISLDKGIAKLSGIEETVNNLICFDNTYKLHSFKIEAMDVADELIRLTFTTSK